MKLFKNPINYCFFMLFQCIALLASVLIMEYIFKIRSCELCQLQRLPYVGLIVISLIGISFPKLRQQMLVVMLIMLAVGILLAFMHIGVERGWPGFSTACTNNFNLGGSFDDFKQSIDNQAIVPCDQVQLRLLGYSLAYWNLLISCVLSAMTVRQIYDAEKDAKK